MPLHSAPVGQTRRQRDALRNRADCTTDLDVEVVDRRRKSVEECRRKHDAGRPRIGNFRVQVWVAAAEFRALVHRARNNTRCARTADAGGQFCSRRSGPLALGERIGRRRACAGVLAREQADRLREEQFEHVRCTNRTLIARPQTEIVDRLPFGAVFVRRDGSGGVVRRITIAAICRQVFDERHVLDQRNANFAVEFGHIVATMDARARASLTGQVAALELLVGVVDEAFLAILEIHRQHRSGILPKAIVRPMRPSRRRQIHQRSARRRRLRESRCRECS